MVGKKVLVVDDSSSIRAQAQFILSKESYSIETAEDGIEGLEKLEQVGDIQLIILDMNMPRMGGLEFLKRKTATKFAPLPVIVITTEDDATMIEEAFQNGAKVWIVKPFQAPHLVKTVKKMLGDE